MVSISIVSLLSALLSLIAIVLVLSIIRKVYGEEHRRPWLFIGISALFLSLSELLRFFWVSYSLVLFNSTLTEAIVYIFVFISIAFLTYGLLLEHLIIKFYKGKFVKMKFIPVQEGTLGGEIDINVSKGNSYLALKKDKNFLTEQFAQATKKGFEGFLITERNPKEIRTKYNLQKTPIGWITQIETSISSDYLKESLDENSDIIEPLQINNMISYIDNFLEQSSSPFLLIDMNLIFRINNYTIVEEFLKYITSRINRYSGICIILINEDVVSKSQLEDLKGFLREIE